MLHWSQPGHVSALLSTGSPSQSLAGKRKEGEVIGMERNVCTRLVLRSPPFPTYLSWSHLPLTSARCYLFLLFPLSTFRILQNGKDERTRKGKRHDMDRWVISLPSHILSYLFHALHLLSTSRKLGMVRRKACHLSLIFVWWPNSL